MKKLFLILILSCFVATGAWALFAPMALVATDSSATDNRPSYYASAILSMNFEDGLDAYDSSGNAVTFTDSGSDIGAYGEGGGQAMKCDAANEDIYKTQTAGQYVDEAAKQTICLKIQRAANGDNSRIFQCFDSENNDGVSIEVRNNNNIAGFYHTEAGIVSAYGYSLDNTTWEYIGYSYEGDTIPNGDHSCNPGDYATWADGWEDDVDEIDNAVTDRPTVIRVGTGNDPSTTILIDEWAIFSGYKVDCKTLMNP